MNKGLRGAALAATMACVGLAGTGSRAEAGPLDFYYARYQGVLSFGNDSLGVFGAPGLITGRTFNLIFKFYPDALDVYPTYTSQLYSEVPLDIYINGKLLELDADADGAYFNVKTTVNTGIYSSRTDVSGSDDGIVLDDSHGVTHYYDAAAIASVATNSGIIPLDPGKNFEYSVKPGDVSGGFFELGPGYTDRFERGELNIFSLTISKDPLFPVPLPPAFPLFGAAILALGAAGYGMKRNSMTAAWPKRAKSH